LLKLILTLKFVVVIPVISMLNKLSLAWPYPMCLVLTEYPSTSKHPTLYQSLFLAYRDNSFAILLINRNYNPTSNPITCLETYFTVKEDVLTLRDDEQLLVRSLQI
jgi:hypothetical protein